MPEKRYDVDWNNRDKVFEIHDSETGDNIEITRSELMENILDRLDKIEKKMGMSE